MPDSDPSPASDPVPSDRPAETRNLPVVLPPPTVAADGGEGWLKRTLRVLFGRKPTSIRAGLKVVLDAGATETAFRPERLPATCWACASARSSA
jgi:hypothetical protein